MIFYEIKITSELRANLWAEQYSVGRQTDWADLWAETIYIAAPLITAWLVVLKKIMLVYWLLVYSYIYTLQLLGFWEIPHKHMIISYLNWESWKVGRNVFLVSKMIEGAWNRSHVINSTTTNFIYFPIIEVILLFCSVKLFALSFSLLQKALSFSTSSFRAHSFSTSNMCPHLIPVELCRFETLTPNYVV